jgi:hypothetical protein
MKTHLIGLVLLALLESVILACGLFPLDSSAIVRMPQNQPTAELWHVSVPTPTFKVIDTLAVQLTLKESGYCKALAPYGWSFTSIPPYVGADLFSPDQSSHAAWGITSIYKALYPTPKSALIYLLNAMGYHNSSLLGEPVEVGYGFMMSGFTSGIGRQGQLIFKLYNLDASFYVISVYLGATTRESWEINGPQALTSAISIRCVSQLRPSSAHLDLDLSDASNAEDNPEVELSEKWSEAILGFENVYSPTTGDHYLASLESYWETGPQGGGYYRELPGGGFEKLMRGFGDY